MTEMWCAGKAECHQCGHEWVAVWPLAAEQLECPHCGSTDTDREQQSANTKGKRPEQGTDAGPV